VRTDLLRFTDLAAQRVVANQHADFVYNLALFIAASVLGLGVSVVITSSVVSRLRQLLDGTRALENGQTATALPETTRDEIGQLARAFNHMIEELRVRERIKDTFGKFIDPRIALQLVGPGAETDQAERRIVTLFFSNIQACSMATSAWWQTPSTLTVASLTSTSVTG
jgi:adenylate cyclase